MWFMRLASVGADTACFLWPPAVKSPRYIFGLGLGFGLVGALRGGGCPPGVSWPKCDPRVGFAVVVWGGR